MIKVKPSKGKLLVAEPSILNDNSFNRSVIFLTEHNEGGSVGFIFNKPTDFTLTDIFPDLNSELPIFYGGPVSSDNLYFIHKIPELIPNSIEISNGFYWGGDFDAVTELLLEDSISKNDIRFFLGYSGWSNNQLEDELSTLSWIVTENKSHNLLKINHDEFWKDEISKFGGVYQIWANAPENPSHN